MTPPALWSVTAIWVTWRSPQQGARRACCGVQSCRLLSVNHPLAVKVLTHIDVLQIPKALCSPHPTLLLTGTSSFSLDDSAWRPAQSGPRSDGTWTCHCLSLTPARLLPQCASTRNALCGARWKKELGFLVVLAQRAAGNGPSTLSPAPRVAPVLRMEERHLPSPLHSGFGLVS